MRIACFASWLVLGLAACTTPSITSIYLGPDDPAAIFDEEYLGTWCEDEEAGKTRFAVRRADELTYLVEIETEGKPDPLELEAHLLVLKSADGAEHRFVDFWPSEKERKRIFDRYACTALPVHAVMPCRWREQDGKRVLELGSLQGRWIEKQARARPDDVPSVPWGDKGIPVLAGEPSRLRQFLAEHADDAGAWKFDLVLRRP